MEPEREDKLKYHVSIDTLEQWQKIKKKYTNAFRTQMEKDIKAKKLDKERDALMKKLDEVCAQAVP
jgi:hypothetical protein